MSVTLKSPIENRPGTKAHARMVRMSASKARVVLNLIRGKQVGEAIEILTFSERLSSEVIGKVLRSAVANAEHNEDLQEDDLFVSACYADEGPTLKRFRPRARGRAGRIHKQTCHITVEVSRLTDDELDELRSRAELKSQSQSKKSGSKGDGGDRSRRVAKSKAAAADSADEDAPEVANATSSDDGAAEEVVEEAAEAVAEETATDGAAESEESETKEEED